MEIVVSLLFWLLILIKIGVLTLPASTWESQALATVSRKKDSIGNETVDYFILKIVDIVSSFSQGFWQDNKIWIDNTVWIDHPNIQ